MLSADSCTNSSIRRTKSFFFLQCYKLSVWTAFYQLVGTILYVEDSFKPIHRSGCKLLGLFATIQRL